MGISTMPCVRLTFCKMRRDKGTCLITKANDCIVTVHIHSASLESETSNITSAELWDFLRAFLDSEKAKAWETQIHTRGPKVTENLMSCEPTVYLLWEERIFA
ncbi:hypothetical protein BDV12DRAFT_175906 [Aspergillus spectabilis]